MMNRQTILNAIFGHFQMVTQWPDSYQSFEYFSKAESLIEALEISDCGSVGGYDKSNPHQYVTECKLFDRFLNLLRKHGDEDNIEPRCGADVVTLTNYFSELMYLRDKVYREHPANG